MPFYHHFKASSSGPILPGTTAFTTAELCDWGSQFPHASLSTHLASLFSLLVAVFLGFLDDLFDIRWRFKLPIPSLSFVPCCVVSGLMISAAVIASIPLLMTYAASLGVTDVILPKVFGLRRLLGVESTGGLVRLGPLYYLYMSLLSTFCTNSINILAGINGVEVGQALVIALSIVVNDFLHLKVDMSSTFPFSLIDGPVYLGMGLARGSAELQDRHLFSLYFMLPLVGVMLALLKFNWYAAPSSFFALLILLCDEQVPGPGVHRRHVLLLRRHDYRRCRYPRALLQDAPALLSPPNLQLYLLVPADLRTRADPSSPSPCSGSFA